MACNKIMESWNLFVDVCILHLLEEKKGEFTNINVCLSVNHQFRDQEDQKTGIKWCSFGILFSKFIHERLLQQVSFINLL